MDSPWSVLSVKRGLACEPGEQGLGSGHEGLTHPTTTHTVFTRTTLNRTPFYHMAFTHKQTMKPNASTQGRPVSALVCVHAQMYVQYHIEGMRMRCLHGCTYCICECIHATAGVILREEPSY